MLTSYKYGLLFILSLSLSTNVMAGKLDNFEKEVQKKKAQDSSSSSTSSSSNSSSNSSSTRSSSSNSSSSSDDSGLDLFLFVGEIIVDFTSTMGERSENRISQNNTANQRLTIEPRTAGESLLPFANLDLTYQMPESSIDVFDMQMELGYAQYGFNLQRSNFNETLEDNSVDKMTITNMNLLYRMSLSSKVEVDLSIGEYEVRGNAITSSVSFGVPVKIQFNDNISFAFKPTWASGIKDHEFAVYAGWDFAKFKVGYRLLSVGSANLNAPFAGVSFHY